ncbi:hypothetical protein ACFOGG_15120 [Brenneria rubrifaciens]
MTVLPEGAHFRAVAAQKTQPEGLRQRYQRIFNHVFSEPISNG